MQSIAQSMEKNKFTLADIARLTGMSTSTVSRALNDSSLISEETKNLIKEVAREHNYQMHLGARNFRLQKSFTVAVVIPIDATSTETLTNPFVLEFIGAIAIELRTYGYNLLLLQDMQINEQYWRSGLVDGFIQLGHGIDYTPLDKLPEEMPLVVWGPTFPNRPYVSIGIDNFELSYQIVKHLINLGRRKIGIIVGDYQDPETEAYQRLQGYQQALGEAGYSIDQRLIGYAGYDATIGYRVAQDFAAQISDLDGIFVGSGDVIALAVIEALRQSGKQVPEDVAVVGFDNCGISENCGIPLTTVSQEIKTTGVQELVQSLMLQIDGQVAHSKVIEGKLIIRRSCGAPLS